MAIQPLEHGVPAKLQRIPHTPSRNSVGSSGTELDLPSLINQLLGQYQELLVSQVEKEVKSKALAAVTEQSRVLHYQAKERIRSVEADVQRKFQTVLERAQERIFEMIGEELEGIFVELEDGFQGMLDEPERKVEGGALLQIVRDLPQEFPEQGRESSPPEAILVESLLPLAAKPAKVAVIAEPHRNVCVELPPPLSQRALMEFYQGLVRVKELQVLQVLGSVDKGVAVYMRPKQVCAVPSLLQTLPGVTEVVDMETGAGLSKEEKGGMSNVLTLRVLLANAGL